MTEEIIKECKNCDALGIDSEIGVYYCCLSHRQDDLPKEFTCNDFTPNKQLKRLEQENKELKETVKDLNQSIQNCNIQRTRMYKALEEIREIAKFNQFYNPEDLLINGNIGQMQDLKMTEIYNRINEVLGDEKISD